MTLVHFSNALIDSDGHIKSFCFRKARCVKCAEDYPTINCTCKKKYNDIKCVLYESNHPANYEGCKDLQKCFSPYFEEKW